MHRDIFAFQAPLRQHNRYAPSCHSLNGASLATRKQCAMTNLTRASLAENPSAPASATPRDRHWDFLLVCVAAYLTTAVGRIHQLFLFLSPLKLVFVSATLAIVLYFLQQVGARRIRWVRSRSTTYLLLLLLWVALSVPGALHQGLAFSLLTSFIKTVALYVLIVGSVRGFHDLERLAFVYFAAASVFSVVVLTRFPVGGNNWRLGGLYYYDANDFAVFAVTAVPLGLYFGLTQAQLHRRLVSLGGVLAVLIAFIWSGSRGGFLAMLAVVAFFLFRYTAVRLHWRLLIMALIIATGWLTASDRYWTQMSTILHADNDYNRTELNGREKIWRRGIGYMLSNPVFGVGGSNFGVAEGTISPQARLQERGIGVRWNAPHNSFVQVGAELGVPGLLLLLAVIGSAFVTLHRVAKVERAPSTRSRAPPQLAQAMQASLVGFVVGAFFLSLAYAEMLYALVALAVALGKVMRIQTRLERWALARAA